MTERALPAFVPPMLARSGPPFDSEAHLYEVKWDGMRTLAYTGGARSRLVNRHRHDVTSRFPELGCLAELEPGAVLDGELVVTVDGKPDFQKVMTRRHASAESSIRALAASMPATFVAFDLVYRGFEPLTDRPLAERREQLAEVLAARRDARLVLSEGIVGQGRALYEHACAQELEGVVAKRLDGLYYPGRRSDTWIKMKRVQTALCLILGFLPDGDRDFKSLIVAADVGGTLRCVGQVGSGIDEARRAKLNRLLYSRLRDAPLIPCDARGRWVEPGLYCTVTYLERTPQGNLRAPVFQALVEE